MSTPGSHRTLEGGDAPDIDIADLVIEDDEPVDSIFSEKQQRLLTEPLYSSWSGPPPKEGGAPRVFIAAANVGYFPKKENNPLVPDMMLAVDVKVHEDFTKKEHLTYFQWDRGKPPDVVIEIVSNRKGGEMTTRFRRYRQSRVPYYVVYDPFGHLRDATLRAFELHGNRYRKMKTPRFESLGLALVEWQGEFEHSADTWLRWCTLDGKVIPTGAERAADAEERARRLEELLRARGIDPRS